MISVSVITEDEEGAVLRENLKEAQTKIKGLEQTVELLQENNKVIDNLRKELEEERQKVTSETTGEMEQLRWVYIMSTLY